MQSHGDFLSVVQCLCSPKPHSMHCPIVLASSVMWINHNQPGGEMLLFLCTLWLARLSCVYMEAFKSRLRPPLPCMDCDPDSNPDSGPAWCSCKHAYAHKGDPIDRGESGGKTPYPAALFPFPGSLYGSLMVLTSSRFGLDRPICMGGKHVLRDIVELWRERGGREGDEER